MQKLIGKTALITGGNSGIGLAIAKLFIEHGASVIITGRSRKSLDEAQKELGSNALAVQADVSKITDLEHLLQRTAKHFGTLNILVANAGAIFPSPFEHVSEKVFDDTVNINFKGLFFTIQKALPILSDPSSVIAVTSITNRMGTPTGSVYGASKAAVRALVKTLGLELIEKGIRVNAISPGPIKTPMFGKFGMPPEAEQAFKEHISQKSPSKRFGEPEEVAKLALFLASSDSSYVVGEEIIVDGGMSLL